MVLGALKIVYSHVTGEFDKATKAINLVIAKAATATMKDVQTDVKTRGRRAIASGGFSTKWQNAFRVNFYPTHGFSTKPAIFAFHKIIYAGVFEKGATIHGSPILWFPVKGLKGFGRQHITPAKWVAKYGPLIRVTSKSGNLLLMGKKTKRKNAKLVPIFIGEDSVKIRRKFNLQNVFATAAAKMPTLYNDHLKA